MTSNQSPFCNEEKPLFLDAQFLRVSSTLGKDVKNFGKANMIDGKEETCWNSDTSHSNAQWIIYGPLRCSTPNSHESASIARQTLPSGSDVNQQQRRRKRVLSSIALMFQGGFAGVRCELQKKHSESSSCASAAEWESVMFFSPKDCSMIQNFPIPTETSSCIPVESCSWIRLIFHSSSDPFGRIVIYHLKLLMKEITVSEDGNLHELNE